jgi:phosphatidate cytidylyltransferase
MVWLHTLDAQMAVWSLLPAGITLVTLASLAWHTLRQREEPIASWSLMIAGGFYLGQCGAAMIQLRNISPDGRWWALTVLSATAFADAGAYLIGRLIGRHALAPHISPGKTWEGYGAGIITGSASSGLLAWLWSVATDATTLTLWRGLLIGILVTTIAPLGDLAISAMKRSAGAKDSGRIMPGHGGALDRADSMLWAAVVGYYAVQALVATGPSAR